MFSTIHKTHKNKTLQEVLLNPKHETRIKTTTISGEGSLSQGIHFNEACYNLCYQPQSITIYELCPLQKPKINYIYILLMLGCIGAKLLGLYEDDAKMDANCIHFSIPNKLHLNSTCARLSRCKTRHIIQRCC